MVIGNSDAAAAAAGGGHPSGIPQDRIDNIMSGIANTGDVKMNNHRKKLRQRFDIIKKLGQGTYGKVQLGINKETGQEVAIKTIKKCKIDAEADLVRIRREVQIMSSVQHPNIIHIYEVFENREKMVLVMEFAAGGELYDYLSERKVLSEEEARRIFRQVATAVYYCHKHKICHRDLKLENILLDEHGNAKIADFGLSNVFDDRRLLATFCGSPLYASPEIVEGTPYQGPEVDCWSLGVLLYTLVYGSMPFDGSNFKRLVKQISQGDYYEPKKPSRASSLIRDMLTVCPRKRATIEQICSHWWVNENDNRSCLDLAEDLANQTPVRLDVLLSLTPAAVTAEQLVVPSADGAGAGKGGDRIPRSHSVGSIRDMGADREAERRILDMVAAGGEAALMPSPTRTITPAQSPIQSKRKLENTVSTENAAGLLKKKEKASVSSAFVSEEAAATSAPLNEVEEETPMETDDEPLPASFSQRDVQNVGNLCTKLFHDETAHESVPTEAVAAAEAAEVPRQKTVGKLDSVEEAPEEKDATKIIRKFVNKHKTADLVNAINKVATEPSNSEAATPTDPAGSNKTAGAKGAAKQFVRKCSLQDETPLTAFNERGKSRILETAEKFQQMNAAANATAAGNNAEKPKKIVIPGVSVGSFKKEFERKASVPSAPLAGPTAGERRALEQVAAAAAAEGNMEAQAKSAADDATASTTTPVTQDTASQDSTIEGSDSKTSFQNLSLDEARRSVENSLASLRRSMENSLAVLRQAHEVDQLCAKTENIEVRDKDPAERKRERERKLKNARAIIEKAIQPASPGGDPNAGTVKTSTAQITLKSATLPRRKTAKTEIQLDIKPRIVEQSPMRFTTEMQHPVADLRSAPAREGPAPYSPVGAAGSNARATSLEPKEHIIPIQRPQVVYSRTGSNATTKSGSSLSRQSTVDSESDNTTTTNANVSQSTVTGSSQPIKKSPREFIIPIAVEGGGFITPREGSIEPSESSHTTTSSKSTFSRLRPTRRIGSLLNDAGVDEGLPFHKMRTASINREGDDDPRFTLHKLRSSRPVKKVSQDNDSQSSGEEDDDDGFEILTAENLFSTLLQRVRALTNRLNVNNDINNSSRLLNNFRQRQSPFWNQEPFGSRLSKASGAGSGNLGAPWRHSMSRDLGSDMDSMFSRTGATLPRGNKRTTGQRRSEDPENAENACDSTDATSTHALRQDDPLELHHVDEPLDLADLDLSRLRLSKKDLETLSSITPGLPKCFQEQLLAKLPPTQARKLSRTLSMQNSPQLAAVRVYKRSQSGGRGLKAPEAATANASSEPKSRATASAENSLSSKSTQQASNASFSKIGDENSDRSSSVICRRSLSRNRFDYDEPAPAAPSTAEASASKSRSNSVGRDDQRKSLCASYSSDVSDKYKYYSPYLTKSGKDTSTDSGSVSPLKRYGSVSPRDSCHSPNTAAGPCPTAAALGRPPSGCLSPPLVAAADGGSSSLRRRSSQRRISRFLRPDFFEEPTEENPYQREKKQRERETQSVLREIREKSRESSRDRLNSYDCQEVLRRKHSLPGDDSDTGKLPTPRHVRNKSLEMHLERNEGTSASHPMAVKGHRRSLSRSRELSEEVDKNELADKILQELQILSAVKSQHEYRLVTPSSAFRGKSASAACTQPQNAVDKLQSAANADRDIEKTATMSKVKQPKPKEKLSKSPTDVDPKDSATTVIKKVKKIIKKSDSIKVTPTDEAQKSAATLSEKPKPESRLKRPKSYPTKDPPASLLHKAENTTSAMPSRLPTKSPAANDNNFETSAPKTASGGTAILETHENRLVRPKSYPTSKLTPPKVTRSAIGLPSSGVSLPSGPDDSGTPSAAKSSSNSKQSTAEEKSTTVTPSGKSSIDSSSSSESRPTTIKKIVKKSKLAQPMATAAVIPTAVQESGETAAPPPTLMKPPKEKSPEKKASKGLLYAIGQKFEKLRDSAMNKEKKSANATNSSASTVDARQSPSPDKASPEKYKDKSKVIKKKKSPDNTGKDLPTPVSDATGKPKATTSTSDSSTKPAKSDKRSRIDAMIRSLRERSVPRSQPATETHFITRAVSVEDMPGTFNKNAVNRVLGLFRRFEKDGSERRVRSTRSTSNIERHMQGSPCSPVYQNVSDRRKSGGFKTLAPVASKRVNLVTPGARDVLCDCDETATPSAPTTKINCSDCLQGRSTHATTKRRDENRLPAKEVPLVPAQPQQQQQQQQQHSNRDKRKALMLDLAKLEKLDNNSAAVCLRPKTCQNGNSNGIYSNLPLGTYSGQQHDNAVVVANNNNNCASSNNNNQPTSIGYRTSSSHEINHNHLFTPSSENIANYSSDSRSYQDDCASTSTFMSPTDEPELCFDNWSICSEDNYILTTPSPTVSRLSRASQFSSPARGSVCGDSSDPNESVIDRIKRRSFYCRFNEKKPRRTSSIVGPAAVRDYYREQQAAVKARNNSNRPNASSNNERPPSPDNAKQFLRPLKLSPAGTELKPPIYKSAQDYAAASTKPRKSLNDIRPITSSPSFISKRYGAAVMNSNDSEFLALTAVPTRLKTSSGSSSYESNGGGGGFYNTYNPKRRSSYNLNGMLPSGSAALGMHNIDGYATVGRRATRPYEQRTMSMLEPPSTSVSSLRREPRTPLADYTKSISRPNSHYRTPSSAQSPTNI